MKAERLENVRGYLRSVIVNEILASGYDEVTTYLPHSKRVDLLLEFEAFVDTIIEQNIELRFKLSKSESKRLSLENDLRLSNGKLKWLEMD